MRQNVFILGASGKVGRTLLQQIAEHDVPEWQRHENPTVVVGVADSCDSKLNPAGFSREALKYAAQSRERVQNLIGGRRAEPLDLNRMLDGIQREGWDGDLVFVDATANRDAMTAFHLRVLKETRHRIVTANKNPLSLNGYDTYHQLTRDPTRYRYSATAMAGLGAIPWIAERVAIGDRVHSMQASLSGTLGFIADHLTQGKSLSEAIRMAIEAGYTEPDFRDDLNGLDVARKLIILAREAGHRVGIEEVQMNRFLPDEYFETPNAETCLRAIAERYDVEMQRRYGDARARGRTLKYLASLEIGEDRPRLTVGLREVPLNSAFGRLAGTDNRIEIVTDIYGPDGPFKLEGPGAGLAHTASVIRRDLLDLQPRVSRLPAL